MSAVLASLLPAALSPAANCSPRRVLLVSTYLHIYVSTDETAGFYNRGCRVEKPVTWSRLLSSHSRWSLIAAWLNWIIGPGKKCHNSEDVMLSWIFQDIALHHHFTTPGLASLTNITSIKCYQEIPLLTHVWPIAGVSRFRNGDGINKLWFALANSTWVIYTVTRLYLWTATTDHEELSTFNIGCLLLDTF